MSCNEIERLLDAFVDDELTPDRRERVERHLDGCAACRRTAKELRALVDAASKLPAGISPGRDLFPSIRRRIEGRGVATPGERAPSSPRMRWIGLAASLLVVAIAGSMALWLRGGPDRLPSPVAPTGEALPARGAGTEPFDAAIREYTQAADLLLAAIAERRDKLSPETMAVLEQNLAIIDRAIDEVRATLEADPTGHENALVLTAIHEQKVELLRRVSRLSS
jgi:hypothetical protein